MLILRIFSGINFLVDLYKTITFLNVYVNLIQVDIIFANSAISDDYLGVSVEEITNTTMGMEVEFRVDLLYGTSVTMTDIQDAFISGLTGRDMDFVDPDSRVLRQMINVTLPSK